MSVALPAGRGPWSRVSAAKLAHAVRGRWPLSQEALALLAAAYLTLTCNATFFRMAAGTGALDGGRGALFGFGLAVAITALNALLLLLPATRWTAKPVVGALLIASALAGHYMSRYGVYLDPDMIRNVLQTDAKESREYLSPGLLASVSLYGLLPASALWLVRLERLPWRTALRRRLAALACAGLVAALAILATYQPLSSLMRNHRTLRYLVTPGNLVVSLASVLRSDAGTGPRIVVGGDAEVAGRAAGARPRLLVLVVGETVRAQNWGLNGYVRQTTPQLARIDGLVNFRDVTACGSSTQVSVPCMFSPYGRRRYDAGKIERSEGLLHVLAHAGIGTLWRDNQTGCKGVCTGLPFESFEHADVPGACTRAGCLDEAMLAGLGTRIERTPGDMVVVLHQLGAHGPAYSRRYPERLARFGPACGAQDLSACSREQIVAAYDNAVLYTDDLLARTIGLLQGISSHDTALLYVSDHGESLGENGLFLHGIPYPIAPDTQLKVPMVLWLSPGMAASRGIDAACLRREASGPVSHDNLFHSVLGLFQVRTEALDPALDLVGKCARRPGPDAAA